MFSITKEDKKIWTEYVSNLNSHTLKFNPKNNVKSNKSLYKINLKESKSFSKLLKKGLLKLDNVVDFHGYRLNDAKIALKNFVIMSYKSNYKNTILTTNRINCGVMIFKVSNFCLEFLEKVWSKKEYINHFWYEQAAIMDLVGLKADITGNLNDNKGNDFYLNKIKNWDL